MKTLGSHFRYVPITRCSVVISIFPRPCYWYILGLFFSTNRWPGPRPRYQYSVQIMRYVFCTDSKSDKGVLLSILYG